MSLSPFLVRILADAERSAALKNMPFELTLENIEEKWEAQGGRGYSTRVPMITDYDAPDWVASIALLQMEDGFTNENTVLEVREASTPLWTREFCESIWGPTPF